MYVCMYVCVCVCVCARNKDVGVAIFGTFLGVVAKLRDVTISFVVSVSRSVCPSVRTEQLCSHWTDFNEI